MHTFLKPTTIAHICTRAISVKTQICDPYLKLEKKYEAT